LTGGKLFWLKTLGALNHQPFGLKTKRANRLRHGDVHKAFRTILMKLNFMDEILTCVRFLPHNCILIERHEKRKTKEVGKRLSWPIIQQITGVVV